MRSFIRRITPINSRSRRPADGSVTLEAALAMPVALLLLLFLIFLIQAAVVSMALQGALSQSVRLAASVWRPIALVAAQAPLDEQANTWQQQLEEAGATLASVGGLLPAPLDEWAREAAAGEWAPERLAANVAFTALARQWADPRVLDPDRLRIRRVELPAADAADGGAWLVVEAEYPLAFRMPWNGRQLVLRQSAAERVWTGGRPWQADDAADGQSEAGALRFVSLEPDPVRRGRKATLTMQAAPGAEVELTVIYKSGVSEAKHLGKATADESGRVSWTWHVSGNTTPGDWSWEVRAADGSVWRQLFTVVGKSQDAGGDGS